MSYSREIKMPTTRREGLANFVQIIINKIEAGDAREALLAAVDLHQDLITGIYDDAMTDKNAQLAAIREMESKHAADIIAAAQKGREDGIAEEKARMSKALGLIAREAV
jgi:hypothetical protein